MKKIAIGAAAAVLTAGALFGMGSARADQDTICGPGGCYSHLGSDVCGLIKNDYYSRGMVIRAIIRLTELRASAQPEVESVVDDAIDNNCPEARRLVYFNNH
jgi:hypothetical protein